MARWRLKAAHYLNVLGTEWEYREVGTTGRQKRLVFPVPLYLDPEDPGDCNRDGDCIVAYEGSEQRGDHVWEGKPTPDMEPLNDEARKISDSFAASWATKVDTFQSDSYGDALARGFFQELMALRASSQPSSIAGPGPAEFEEMRNTLAQLTAQNAALIERLNAVAPEAGTRRT